MKVNIGFLSPPQSQLPGAELDLALIAGFLVIFLAGLGRFSLDYALGIDKDVAEVRSSRR